MKYSYLLIPLIFCFVKFTSAQVLLDNFVVGDGSGITYTEGGIAGQSGGSGWAAGSEWSQGGRTFSANVESGDFLRISASNPGQTQSAIRSIWREYSEPTVSLSSMRIRTTIELFDLSGSENILNTSAANTTSGGDVADDLFAFFPRTSAGNVNTNALWYVEAAAGFWWALPGNGTSSNYGSPIQLAPLVQGETYELEISFSGNDTWAASIYMVNADESYSTGFMDYIGTSSTDANLLNFIHYRALVDQNSLSDPFDVRIHSLEIIPEPGTYAAILGAGLALLVFIRRRLSSKEK